MDVGKTLGYKFHVLIDTIEETQGLLNYKAEYFNNTIIQKYVNKEDIYNACTRLNYSRADLERIADNLEKQIENFGINVIPNTTSYRNKAKFSNEFKLLKQLRSSEKSALHDALCITYVKEKRGNKNVHDFEKIKCWFVNNAISHDYENEGINSVLNQNNYNGLPETIKVDDLLNILWLSSPAVEALENDEIVDMGLTSLVAYTLNKALPKSRIIKELDENIQKYKNSDITDKDVFLLSSRIANGQIKDIEKLNELASIDVVKFNNAVKEEANKQREIERQRAEALENVVNRLANSITEIQKHKIEIEEKNKKQFEKKIEISKNEFDEKLRQKEIKFEEKIKRKDDNIEQLKKDNIKKENQIRNIKRDLFVKNQIKKWRRNTWIWVIVFAVLLVLSIVWALFTNEEINTKSNVINKLMNSSALSIISPLVISVINIFLIKNLYDKYYNYSNIKAYKESIQIPDEMQELV